eukprot:scaffold8972_cov118-Isochrysis_galbana.AAC.15
MCAVWPGRVGYRLPTTGPKGIGATKRRVSGMLHGCGGWAQSANHQSCHARRCRLFARPRPRPYRSRHARHSVEVGARESAAHTAHGASAPPPCALRSSFTLGLDARGPRSTHVYHSRT